MPRRPLDHLPPRPPGPECGAGGIGVWIYVPEGSHRRCGGGMADPDHEGQRQPRRPEPDERRRARDCGEILGNASSNGRREGRSELPWWPWRSEPCGPGMFPPGPADDWSGVPEQLWPATTESVLRRMAHGPANRLDRLRALGNGVVP